MTAVRDAARWRPAGDAQAFQRALVFEDGHITMPELPGIGIEGKSDLIKVMRELAA